MTTSLKFMSSYCRDLVRNAVNKANKAQIDWDDRALILANLKHDDDTRIAVALGAPPALLDKILDYASSHGSPPVWTSAVPIDRVREYFRHPRHKHFRDTLAERVPDLKRVVVMRRNDPAMRYLSDLVLTDSVEPEAPLPNADEFEELLSLHSQRKPN